MALGFHLDRVKVIGVAQRGKFGMADQRIVVEHHFDIDRHELFVARHHQGIDFDQACIEILESTVQFLEQSRRVIAQAIVKAQATGQIGEVRRRRGRSLADNQRLHDGRVARRLVLDILAALFRADKRHPAGARVDHCGDE